MVNSVTIAHRKVGPGEPCFIIAEAGVNHNGRLDLACQLVDAAHAAGVDAVKFQTFKSEKVVTADARKAEYQVQNTGTTESQLDMIRKLELSYDDHRKLIAHCASRGILFMSTPFDEDSADFLAEMEVPVFKIPSGEITNIPLMEHIAGKGKPLIVSTGMASIGEVETAVRTLTRLDGGGLVLLQCTSNYPAAPADSNLRAMGTMAAAFGVPVGYSDHTLGVEIALAAVALGACVLEKHFTLDRSLPGPDHQASLEPGELTDLVRAVRNVEAALGDGIKMPAASEADTAAVARRSLVAAEDIAEGAVITAEVIVIRRPGTGLPPAMRPFVIGRSARLPIRAGTLLSLEMLA